jgi:hypothetical protein
VKEEDVVNELDGKSLAYTRTKSMDNTSSHKTSIGFSLRSTKKAKHELKWSVHSRNVH